MIINNLKQAADYSIGGKATGLYKLKKLKLSVPDFIVIPSETFDPFIQDCRKKGVAQEHLAEAFLNFRLSEKELQTAGQIIKGWRFPQKAVVVRSSVADEDSAENAFPGMMDSFLNLRNLNDVAEAIARCAGSAFSLRALAYRKEKGISRVIRPAVIIQQQINPDVSGVTFTTSPEYPQEMAIHAVPGFGEGLVGGTTEGDEYYLLKTSGVLNRQLIRTKETSFQAAGEKGLAAVSLPDEQQNTPCLSPAQLRQLWEGGQMAEKESGGPQDIEFAVKDNTIWWLQCRPVTLEIPEVIVYDNSNIQESYCGVTTPLTFSFASRAYATVYRQTMEILGLPQNIITKNEPVVNNLLGLVKGRIYYHINNWYRGLQLLPSFSQNKEDMERMMGVEEAVDFIEDRKKTIIEKVRILPVLLGNLARLLYHFSRLSKSVPAFQEHFRLQYGKFYQQDLSLLSNSALLEQKEKLDKELLRNWTTPIINDFYVMMNNGRARRKLKKAGIAAPDEFLSHFLSGDQEIESTQPTKAMMLLARKVTENPDLKALIMQQPPGLHLLIRSHSPLFYQEAEAFMAKYGDRTVGELKLETHTMRTHPDIFYKYLKNFLYDDSPVLTDHVQGGSTLSAGAGQELSALLKRKNVLFRKSVWKILDKLKTSIRYRESLRLERTRLFGMYRAMYLEMGNSLVRTGALENPEDIFYLEENEILAALKNPAENLRPLCQSRREKFEEHKKAEVPSRVVIPFPPSGSGEEDKGSEPGILRGSGCYPGKASGEVIVIRDPADSLEVKGKIVCALRTDPGWAALFPACKGVLIEKGSSLSHSVILLRELGIPTIINIAGLTKKLQSGNTVRMDGSTGEIILADHE